MKYKILFTTLISVVLFKQPLPLLALENELTASDSSNIVTTYIRHEQVSTPSASPEDFVLKTDTVTTQVIATASGTIQTVIADTALESTESAGISLEQTNNATASSTIEENTNTGNLIANNNNGSTRIETGDIKTSAQILTTINTNADTLQIAEFNISDNLTGDYKLDFTEHCITVCDSTQDQVAPYNTDNFQNNNGTIENLIDISADTGNNTISQNTNGTATIATGDVYISATVINVVNNNIAGNVKIGVVNLYSDVNGDIIFPEEYYDASNEQESIDTQSALQKNAAIINNDITIEATTGSNLTDDNSVGTMAMKTGSTVVNAQTTTIANKNIAGNLFLVIMNNAGNWIGTIFGNDSSAPNSIAGGSEMLTDESTIKQSNDIRINNTIKISANTGNNTASQNIGEEISINTGDIALFANTINIVNNNITASGKMIITVINVFKTWKGDFILPWAKKPIAEDDYVEVDSGTSQGEHTASTSTSPDDNNNQTQQSQIDTTTQITPTPSIVQRTAISQPTIASPTVTVTPIHEETIATPSSLVRDNISGEVAGVSDAINLHKTIKSYWSLLLFALALALGIYAIKKMLNHINYESSYNTCFR